MSKTTLQGVLTILAGVVAFFLNALKDGNWFDTIALATLAAAVTAGLGLIKAQDATP
jgi:hypothetical protein